MVSLCVWSFCRFKSQFYLSVNQLNSNNSLPDPAINRSIIVLGAIVLEDKDNYGVCNNKIEYESEEEFYAYMHMHVLSQMSYHVGVGINFFPSWVSNPEYNDFHLHVNI